MKGNKPFLILIFAAVIFFSAGCANRVEIDDRSIVLGVAIDKPAAPKEEEQGREQQGGTQTGNQQNQGAGSGPDSQEKQESEEFLRPAPPPKDQTPRYAMTIETPIIKAFAGGGGDGGGGSGGGPKKLVLSATGDTFWDIERSLSIRIGRQDFYGHLKVLIISEEVAREGILPVMDFFTRRREIQQNIKLAIANGEARKVLEVEPPEEDFAAFYLDLMLQSLYRTAVKINTNMLEIRRDLADSGGNAVLPRVRASSPTEIVAAGAAVVKDWKFVGWLSEVETSGYNSVRGNITGGSINIVDPKDPGGFLTVLLRGAQVKRSVELVEGKPIFTIEGTSEWDIVEQGTGTMLWDRDYLEQVEHRIEMEFQRRCIHIVDKMQREFKVDVFGFGNMLAQKYPDYWKTVKNQWDEQHFPEAEVNVKITADIRRTETKT